MSKTSLLSQAALAIGGPRREKQVLDLGRSVVYGGRISRYWARRGSHFFIVWSAVLVWVATMFYRAIVRKDELIAEREERTRTGPAADAAPPSPQATP